ncbi:hypothetical protein EKO23_23575 [Nocardioides guangzhouensis]|uniref:Periplasmic copper-binding protein NosD beta helix domain-containing protein n=1 Tax=Nocardioides guangzhouensis TaxID=2497878 RepID=A0A4Q4Z3C2_9ACTN|nr:right-handed parallel beta-helix repeat-containing protein [Nocardioides guangzhouensis]RYP81446.1 hypothetical protein EKO23_23575 [Nocardioides guangzhouensis]
MKTLKRISASSLVAVCTIAMSPTALEATEPATIVVDDDRLQCPDADLDTISAAVASAKPGDTVQVCPGVYPEVVQIDRPLTLAGTPGVEAFDCFGTAPSQAGDLDPTTYAVLTRPPGIEGNLLTVASAGVTVTGMVLEGALGEPVDSIYDAALHLLSGTAGARVHHNLIRRNSLGIDLGSDGSATTRVDHNCLRDNQFGMASQRQDFVGGVVENNNTFRNTILAYEVGWPRASTRQSLFAHNVSRQDRITFTVSNSWNVSIADNDIEPASTGVQPASGNTNIRITGNRIFGGTTAGVAFSATAGPTSQKALVAGNDISGFGRTPTGGIGIAVATNAAGVPSIDGVKVMDNVLSHNAVGISVQLNNLGVQVHGNTSNDNRQFGIRAQFLFGTASSASFKDNVMLGNGSPNLVPSADAFDNNRPANTWAGNVCERDIPIGTICQS